MFELPENLAPECYPLAWTVGYWRGFGLLGYPGIDDAAILCELDVTNNGMPYLSVHSRWYLAKESPEAINNELAGSIGYEGLTKDRLWAEATGYLRPSSEGEGELEAMMSTPDGRVALYIGVIQGPRMQFISDAMVRSATGPEVNSAQLQVGLVESDLLFAYDMAAFGNEMQSYSAGRMSRYGSINDAIDNPSAEESDGE